MVLIPPPSQELDKPGTIRWAVGTPEEPRSHTWSVVGHPTADDVFVGIRDHMHVIKLSLHESKWRMTYTEQAAARHVAPGEDRVVTRWNQPPEMAPGWRHAACIVITTSNLGYGYPEKRVRGGGRVSWFPPTFPRSGLRFDVMLSLPGCGQLSVGNIIGEVGRMTLRSGAGVWIVGTEFRTTRKYEAELAELRQEVYELAKGEPAAVRGWGWGEIGDGVPQLVDLSNVLPPSAAVQRRSRLGELLARLRNRRKVV